MKVVIINGYAEHGDEMALYVDGKLISTAEIDGSNDAPESLMDFMSEFGVGPKECGITDIAMLDEVPDVVTDYRPCVDQSNGVTDEQYAEYDKMEAAGIIDEDGAYVYPENLSNIENMLDLD